MKTKNFLTAIMMVSGLSFFMTSCSEDTTTTEYITKVYGCMDNTAINFNAAANVEDSTCIYASQLDDTTRTVFSEAEHTADATKKPWIDQTHSNLMWESDYKELGLSTLTGRFINFDGNVTFDENEPAKTHFSGWAQVSTNFTGETGRDNPNTGCMPRDLGVRWYTHEEISGTDTTIVQDSIVENSDFAYLDTKLGECEFYTQSNKRGFTTTYRVPAVLKFKEEGTTTNNGPLKQSDVMVYFFYNGIDYATGRSGITGYFEFLSKTNHGVKSTTSNADKVTVNFNMQIRYK